MVDKAPPTVSPSRLPNGSLAIKPSDGRIYTKEGSGWSLRGTLRGTLRGKLGPNRNPVLVSAAAGPYYKPRKRGRSDSADGAGAGAGVGYGAGTGGAGGAGGAGGGTEGGRPKRARPSEAVLAFIGDMTDEVATIEAAKEGRVDVLEHLHAKGATLNVRDNEAAVWAAGGGHLEVLEFLEGKPGINFAAQDNGAAVLAAWDDHLAVLKFLEGKLGVDFSAGDNEAAIRAAENGHLAVLEFLKGKGVDFAAQDNRAALLAAWNDHLHVLKFLEGKPGVDFSACDNLAAIHAAKHGHLHILEFLEGRPGVDFSAQGDYAACLAAERRHLHVLEFLAKQPHVRMATAFRIAAMHSKWQAARQAWEVKQDVFVASARSGSLTAEDVKQAQRDELIFRELERGRGRDNLNPAVRKLVDAQIAREYNEVAWRNGPSRQLVAHWGAHRARLRGARGKGPGAVAAVHGSVPGNALSKVWAKMPRAAVGVVLQQVQQVKGKH